MSNTFSTQLTQQRNTDAGGREVRFRGDLYSQESTFPLVMPVSSIVPEKSRGNKKCDEEELEEEEELRHIFGRFGITVKWP